MNNLILIAAGVILLAIFAFFYFQRFLFNWRCNLILSKLRDQGWHPSTHILVDPAWIPLLESLINKGHVVQRLEKQQAEYQITARGMKRIEKLYKRIDRKKGKKG